MEEAENTKLWSGDAIPDEGFPGLSEMFFDDFLCFSADLDTERIS